LKQARKNILLFLPYSFFRLFQVLLSYSYYIITFLRYCLIIPAVVAPLSAFELSQLVAAYLCSITSVMKFEEDSLTPLLVMMAYHPHHHSLIVASSLVEDSSLSAVGLDLHKSK
jgi:hypothetical protein